MQNKWICLPQPLFLLLTGFFELSSTLKYGILKMQIGSVELQLEEGDLTEQKTDAIVNITNHTFNLRNGMFSINTIGVLPQILS